MLCRILIYFFLLLSVSVPSHATTAQTAPLSVRDDEVLDLAGFTAWCSADSDRRVEEITQGGCTFLPTSEKDSLKKGFSSRAFWLKFELYNPTSKVISRWLRVGHPRLQSVNLYEFSQGGMWRETKTGIDVPSMDRPIVTEFPTLPIELQPYEKHAFLVRVSSETLVDLTTTLMTSRAYMLSTHLSRLISYMSIGAALLACVFCLIIFTRLREKSLLLLAGTLVSAALFDAGYTGLTATIIWPASAPFPIRIQAAMICLSLLFFSAFVLSYIPANVWLTRIKIATFLMLGSSIALALYALAFSYSDILFYMITLAFLIVASLTILIIVVRRFGAYPPRSILWCLGPILLIVASRWMIAAGLIQQQFIQSIGFSWALTILSPIIIGGIVKRAEDDRRRLSEIAMDAAVRNEFVAYMSHEFRSPLNLIINYADLVSRGSPRVTIKEAMTAISDGGREVLSLVDGILDYMRRESSDVTLDLAPTELMPFLQGIASEANQMTAITGNRFDMNVKGAMPDTVEIDELRLKHVLRNLIGNANRYTKHGSVMFSCHAEHTSAGRCRLDFSILDTGIGIEQQDLSRIFEPYVRGEAARQSGQIGFGIGLALSKSILERMGSSLSVVSSRGEGSKFSFAIDCAIVIDSVDHRLVSPDLGRPSRVLLVDDDPQALLLLMRLLSHLDAELLTARSGKEAEGQLEKEIDLVITDQFMQDGDGWHVLKEAAAYRIPVVLISAAEPQRPPGLDEVFQFAAVFRKPIDIETLDATVRHILGISTEGSSSADEPVIVVEHAVQVLFPPDVEQLSILRQLVREGAVSKIEDWIAHGETKYPDHSHFYVAVRSACSNLDFKQLAELARERRS